MNSSPLRCALGLFLWLMACSEASEETDVPGEPTIVEQIHEPSARETRAGRVLDRGVHVTPGMADPIPGPKIALDRLRRASRYPR